MSFSCFLNWKFSLGEGFGDVGDVKKNVMVQLHMIRISEMIAKRTFLKKINVSFIVHFCLGKYSFSLDTFWTYFISWKKELMFHSLFISVLVNTVLILIHFKHTLYFEENYHFIHNKYPFSFNTFWTYFALCFFDLSIIVSHVAMAFTNWNAFKSLE